jgi:hypothetical protein
MDQNPNTKRNSRSFFLTFFSVSEYVKFVLLPMAIMGLIGSLLGKSIFFLPLAISLGWLPFVLLFSLIANLKLPNPPGLKTILGKTSGQKTSFARMAAIIIALIILIIGWVAAYWPDLQG